MIAAEYPMDDLVQAARHMDIVAASNIIPEGHIDLGDAEDPKLKRSKQTTEVGF